MQPNDTPPFTKQRRSARRRSLWLAFGAMVAFLSVDALAAQTAEGNGSCQVKVRRQILGTNVGQSWVCTSAFAGIGVATSSNGTPWNVISWRATGANPTAINVRFTANGASIGDFAQLTHETEMNRTSGAINRWGAELNTNYAVCVRRTSGSGAVYLTADIFTKDCGWPTHVNNRGTCFRAVGANCNGPNLLTNGGSCARQADGRMSCYVSVGSNMHDSCCSNTVFNANNCGGNNSNNACSAEWNHAQNDWVSGRSWANVIFNPTVVTYRFTGSSRLGAPGTVSERNACGNTVAHFSWTPNSNAMRAPNNFDIWDGHARRGWCASGRFTQGCTLGVPYGRCVQ